jgi:hypothetical protein
MSVTIQGTIKTGGAFAIKTKDKKEMTLVSFVVVDEMGTSYPCQMWPDDPQHEQLIQVIGNARRHPVRCLVSSYSLRMREFKDGRPSQPQINFIVSNIEIPQLLTSAAPAVPTGN